MAQRKINFNAGPAALPPEVLIEASQAVLNYGNTGLSILQIPHRSKEAIEIIEESKALVRELCGLGMNYEIVWLQGGGRMQFAMLPMNFLQGGSAGYIDSGYWAQNAAAYAGFYGTTELIASSKVTNYNCLPVLPAHLPSALRYVHFTTNNTIYGTQWHTLPSVAAPLVADMSSDILSGTRDYTRFALFYAVAQKNLGAAGNTLVAIRNDFLQHAAENLPPMLSYKSHIKENSILNTANIFGIYITLLCLRWTKERGMDRIEQNNTTKAAMLYEAIDNNPAFIPHVTTPADRSKMNICFTTRTQDVEKKLLALCEEYGITGIKGHRSVGGFRVSLYNAVTIQDVSVLVDLMSRITN